MPHAEDSSVSAILNGGCDKHSSQFLSHLASYPVVSDSIETFKTNPMGDKCISLAERATDTFVKPVLPLAQGPYNYIFPYVERADQLASSTLDRVDDRFPIVKEDTKKIRGTILDYIFHPVVIAGRQKDYVFQTYGSEYKKCGGDGYVASGKAVVTTSLIAVSDVLEWFSEFLRQSKGQAEAAVKEKTNN